jgi:hypothetical protein
MPSPRSQLRNRRGYSIGHFSHLATAHDFFGDGFGHLDKLPINDLPAVVESMAECWHQHQSEIAAECAPREPWFAQYAAAPQQLIDEVIAQRDYAKRYPHGSECCCASCTP